MVLLQQVGTQVLFVKTINKMPLFQKPLFYCPKCRGTVQQTNKELGVVEIAIGSQFQEDLLIHDHCGSK